MEIKQFPGYGPLEGIDYANWPVWLVCGIVGLVVIGFIAYALSKALD